MTFSSLIFLGEGEREKKERGKRECLWRVMKADKVSIGSIENKEACVMCSG